MLQLHNGQLGFMGNDKDENKNSCQDSSSNVPSTPTTTAADASTNQMKQVNKKSRKSQEKEKKKEKKRKTIKATGADSDGLPTTSSTTTPTTPKTKKEKEKSRKRSSSPIFLKRRNSLVPDYSEGYRTATKATKDSNGLPLKTFTYKRANKDGTTTV